MAPLGKEKHHAELSCHVARCVGLVSAAQMLLNIYPSTLYGDRWQSYRLSACCAVCLDTDWLRMAAEEDLFHERNAKIHFKYQ